MRISDAHQLCGGIAIMTHFFDITAPKKATNLTINSDLLEIAKNLKINISATLEEALAKRVQQKKTASWLAENKLAIQEYNKFIEKHGVFSDGLRKF